MDLKLNENEKFEIIGGLCAIVGSVIGFQGASMFFSHRAKKELNYIEKSYEELLKCGGTEEQWNDLYERAVDVATLNTALSRKVRERARIVLKKVKERKEVD